MIKQDNIIKRQLQLNFREEVYANGDPCYSGGEYLAKYFDKEGRIATIDNEMEAIIDLFFLYLDEQNKRRKWADKHHHFRNYKTDYKYISNYKSIQNLKLTTN